MKVRIVYKNDGYYPQYRKFFMWRYYKNIDNIIKCFISVSDAKDYCYKQHSPISKPFIMWRGNV